MTTRNNQLPDPFTYKPWKPEPQFKSYKLINSLLDISPEDYSEWRISLPVSPIDPGIRMVIRSAYTMMDHRMGMGNQVFSQFRARLGLAPSDKTEAEKDAAKALVKLAESYKTITEGCAKELPLCKNFKADGLITTYAELVLVDSFFRLKKNEDFQFGKLVDVLTGITIYDLFLAQVGGCGPKLSGMLLAELNPYRAPNVSSFWRFMGLDVHIITGRGRGTRLEQMEERWMAKRVQGKEGDPVAYKMERVTLRTYCARRKSRLVFTGMETIMKAGIRWMDCTKEAYDSTPDHLRRIKDVAAKVDKATGEKVPARKAVMQAAVISCKYCLIYLGYKHRLLHSEKPCPSGKDGKPLMWKDTSDGHRHAAARRYMAKMFLADLWLYWRMLEGLPITEPYAVAVLGHRPHHEGNVPPRRVYTGEIDGLDEGLDLDDII